IYMFSFVIEREKDVLNSLAAAGIIILVIDPCALFAISFQLSFSAVLFIILGIYITREIPFFKKKNLITKFSMFVIVSFCAGLGTMPLVMHYFNIVSFVQLVTNLVIIPVVGFIVVPLGLAALFIFPFSELISGLLIKLAIPFLSFSISFTEYLSLLPFTWAKCVTPHVIEIICYYAFMLGIFYSVLKKNKKGLYVMTLSLLLFFFYTGFILKQRYFNENLQITVLDVGQGSSALIEGPKGARILVDGGGFSYSSTFDTGRHLVAPFLWNKKILTLDAVILTHPERDHMNGLVYIVENFDVKKFIKNSDIRETKSYLDLMKTCLRNDIPIAEFPYEKNNELDIGELNIAFLYPIVRKKGVDKLEKNDYNNNSLVFKVKYKDFVTLFPGDIMEKTERKLAQTVPDDLKADILIAPHHGSSTSSSSFFLDKVDPESIIISCGWQNRYNFPDHKIIARYKEKNINFYRTDHHGAVKIISDGEHYKIETF
ncbi:MAG: DNA internalization-related competence protein ComEC/Rec2, partial [Desulfobacteraceae bacterium]|nr:DNA internalization-related competence protein ComEC/Rec2 [Desulfobacteraceae bacterium]